MKSIIGTLASLLVLIFLIALIAIAKMEFILSYMLTDKLKTRVAIEDITFSPMDKIDVKNISIANPDAYSSPYALQVGSLDIQANYRNYTKEVVIIEKIELSNVTLTVDYIKNVSNWEALMNQLDTSDEGDPNSYSVIEELTFRNLKVNIIGKDGKLQSQTIPKLTLTNIKTKGGELTRRLTQAILTQLIFNIQNVIKIPLKMGQDLLNAPVESTWDGIKSLNPFNK
jgi:hypothetical protein